MSTAETLLPDVGARIRFTRTHETGPVVTVEGIVTPYDREARNWVRFGAGGTWDLRDRDGWTVTVEVLEAAPKPQPAEPPLMGVVEIGKGEAGSLLFRHTGEDRYVDLTDPSAAAYTWDGVCTLGTPVPLVAAPDLAELVEALRVEVEGYHCVQHSGPFAGCDRPSCVERRALLARHAGEQADRG